MVCPMQNRGGGLKRENKKPAQQQNRQGTVPGFEAGLLSGFEVACLECQFYAAQGFFPAQNRGNFAGAAGGCFQPGQGDAYRIQNLSVFQPVGGGDRFQAFKQALVIPAVRTQAFQCRERELKRFFGDFRVGLHLLVVKQFFAVSGQGFNETGGFGDVV